VHLGEPLERAIITGAGEVGVPTLLATLCICIVFVPVFLLQGTAKYLFSPLSLAVMRVADRKPCAVVHPGAGIVQVPHALAGVGRHCRRGQGKRFAGTRANAFMAIHYGFDRRFQRFREGYRNTLAWTLADPCRPSSFSQP